MNVIATEHSVHWPSRVQGSNSPLCVSTGEGEGGAMPGIGPLWSPAVQGDGGCPRRLDSGFRRNDEMRGAQ